MKSSDQQCGCATTSRPNTAPVTMALPPPPSARPFVVGAVVTPAGSVPQISTALELRDHAGTVRARSGIRRDDYRVDPGLYAVGTPTERSDVLVTANYKLTFDVVRHNLAGLNAWLLVLDTKGVNVWCAAGKGTFGTEELLQRIRLTALDRIVIHRRLIVPQLGATGVAAHLVKKASGFTVVYGPVRAADIRAFIQAGYKATTDMRQVRFGWHERLVVVPNDFVYGLRYLLAAVAVCTVVSTIDRNGISWQKGLTQAVLAATGIGAGYVSGIVLTPLLLPFLPFRMFAFKGFVAGAVVSLLLAANSLLGAGMIERAGWILVGSAVSSFMAMNFTGSSTFTSLSGVRKEMKIAVPVQIASAAAGTLLMITRNIIL